LDGGPRNPSWGDPTQAGPGHKPDPADQARFKTCSGALAQQSHCVVCRRSDLSGQQTVPRLASQREDYLLKTLREI